LSIWTVKILPFEIEEDAAGIVIAPAHEYMNFFRRHEWCFMYGFYQGLRTFSLFIHIRCILKL
jgi:hypothetical protein